MMWIWLFHCTTLMRVDNIMGSAMLGLCVLALFLCAPFADARRERETCMFDDIDLLGYYHDDYYYSEEIADNATDKVVAEITTINITDIQFEHEYLTHEFNDNKLIIKTTSNFNEYEENTSSSGGIEVPMNITCSNTKTYEIIFYQPIEDLNNHEPTFNSAEYTFVHYGYLPGSFDISNFIEISTTDLDPSDTMHFSTSSKKLELYSFNVEDKTTYALLKTNGGTSPPFNDTITLTVRDGYYDDVIKETNATFYLKVLEDLNEFKFTKEKYSASIKGDRITTVDPIRFENGIDHDLRVTIVESAYSEFFSVYVDHITGTIKLTLEEDLPDVPKGKSLFAADDHVDEVHLKLKATWREKSAETEVVIASDKPVSLLCIIPGIDIIRPHFYNPNDVNDSFVGAVFTAVGTENVAAITCEGSEYLTCEFNADTHEFKVLTTDKFAKYEEHETKTTIKTTITIECPYKPVKVEFLQKINDINNHNPSFAEVEYTFTFYDEIPKEYEITKLSDIVVTDYDLTSNYCYLKFADNDDKWFRPGYTPNFVNKTCNAKVYANDAIRAPFNRTITLTVKDDTVPKRQNETKLHIRVIPNTHTIFSFTQSEYFMKINRTTKTIVKHEDYETPRLVNGLDSLIEFSIAHESYANMFIPKPNVFTSALDIMLENNVLLCEDCNFVTLPIVATWKGRTSNTTLVVILNEDYHPTTEDPNTTVVSEKPTAAPTEVPTAAPIHSGDGNHFGGFNTFMLTSTIGIISIFVTVTVTLTAMIYMARRLFLARRETMAQPLCHEHADPLPEKMPIP